MIGNAAHFIEIKTFHSYCFDLLGKIGNIEESENIIKTVVDKIGDGQVEINRITKTVLVIDEAQDMDQHEFNLIKSLMRQNEEMRVIAVGDDDQNIYEFRGSSSEHLEQFTRMARSAKHELIENFRSPANLVDFTNQFAQTITHRLKETPIISGCPGMGMIKIVHHQSAHLIIPIVNSVMATELSGSTCILTRTNEEALQVTGLLAKHKIAARLIQSNDFFPLYDLAEIRFFLNQVQPDEGVFVITDEAWNEGKRAFENKYAESTCFQVCINVIRDFEAANSGKKYFSDLHVFIRESKMEDFLETDNETIFVSTMHKAKGREFDNVFLLLVNYQATTDEARRLLYVAMTRAKKNLTIHLNNKILHHISAQNLMHIEDKSEYLIPIELAMHLSFKDVWLDFFVRKQYAINRLKSGDELICNGIECTTSRGEPVLRFSKSFADRIESMKQKNYIIHSVKVNFIVFWKKDEAEKEVKVILPEISFLYQHGNKI